MFSTPWATNDGSRRSLTPGAPLKATALGPSALGGSFQYKSVQEWLESRRQGRQGGAVSKRTHHSL